MSITVKQEVATILTVQQATYGNAALLLEGDAREHYEAVASVLGDILEQYTTPEFAPDQPRDFQVGDKVRLTGTGWSRHYHGVEAGDVVTVNGYDDEETAVDHEATFESKGLRWYVYTSQSEHYDDWGGDLIEDDDVIRVGDTVRIKENYAATGGGGRDEVGQEFVVTEVVPAVWGLHTIDTRSEFYVEGDRRGWGVWEAYIEKVHK